MAWELGYNTFPRVDCERSVVELFVEGVSSTSSTSCDVVRGGVPKEHVESKDLLFAFFISPRRIIGLPCLTTAV